MLNIEHGLVRNVEQALPRRSVTGPLSMFLAPGRRRVVSPPTSRIELITSETLVERKMVPNRSQPSQC